MVMQATSLTGNGTRDWLVQRVSAVILAAYTLFLLGYVLMHQPLDYLQWRGLFDHGWMRIFSFLTLLSMLYHTWIGMWTVFTDYITCPCLRLGLQVAVIIALLSYLVWGVCIVWGL